MAPDDKIWCSNLLSDFGLLTSVDSQFKAGSEANWVQVSALPLHGCVILGKFPCLSESEFPNSKIGMPASQDVVMITGHNNMKVLKNVY